MTADELIAQEARGEAVEPGLCVKLARAAFDDGDLDAAYSWLVRVAAAPADYRAWASAAKALDRFAERGLPHARRAVRVALAGSYTTGQLGALLRLAALERGVWIELYEAGYNAFEQELLDPGSALYAADPDYVLLAVHEGAVRLPVLADDPEAAVSTEAARWHALWNAVHKHSRARLLVHNFVVRPDSAWGHLAAREPRARDAMLHALNRRLAQASSDGVLVVDCERVASAFGKLRWFDDRYWHISKQAVALDALPELARHTAAVLAAGEGLGAKCVVVDLDNTLWGGVIAEQGVQGIRLGAGPQGEAFVAFQELLLALRQRGVLLAVVSKNNDRDAREPFELHPDMRLALGDFAAFRANWEDKASNLRAVARELNIGLDALVFVDDNPAEREVVRQLVPEVTVVMLPSDPAGYGRALIDTLRFEAAQLTGEDLARSAHYRARAAAEALERESGTLDGFYRSLEMEAFTAPFDELNLTRIVQLIGKTNQFNLTTRRYGAPEVRSFMDDDRYVTLYLRLRDRFADHGLVAVLVAIRDGDELAIDEWLMSCRVIGRTVEHAMLRELCLAACELGCTRILGTFVPSAKNAIVSDLYPNLGFAATGSAGDVTRWRYDIAEHGVPESDYIRGPVAIDN